MIVCVDFDKTIVKTNGHYQIVRLKRGAKRVINKWFRRGHYIIVNTLRQNDKLKQASFFMMQNGVQFDQLNDNMPLMVKRWGQTRFKVGANIYIDDRNIVPLTNWFIIDLLLYVWEALFRVGKKPRILCIVGESGTGKTTVAEYIEREYGIPMILSYTDRPKRTEDEVGHTWVTSSQFDKFNLDDMIAFTTFGAYRYCCLKKDVKRLNTYVIDEPGLKYLKENFGEQFDLITLRMVCDPMERLNRVSIDRMNRDLGKFKMPHDEFDFVVHSAYSKEHTLAQIDFIIREFLNFS